MRLFINGEERVNLLEGYNSSHPKHRKKDDDKNDLLNKDKRIEKLEEQVAQLLAVISANPPSGNVPVPKPPSMPSDKPSLFA